MESSRKLSIFAKLAIAAGAFVLMSLVGNFHYAAALTDEAIEKEERPKRVIALYGRGYRPDLPQRLVLMRPIDCSAVTDADVKVNQRMYYTERGETLCYYRRER